LPAALMLASTGTALVLNFRLFYGRYLVDHAAMTLTNMCIAGVLFMLGALVVFEALRVWRKARSVAAGFPVQAMQA
jgi:hypothetical protein